MSKIRAKQILKHFNKWRRGFYLVLPFSSRQVGIAIDALTDD